ncbi:MAG TPA: ribosome recycling factor [Candidatus Moranbacteria bacterium]|nr:ribosome recycling factor [Candidatus Moranbacteria bacterium]
MSYMEAISSKQTDFDKAIEHFKAEAGKLRTGRATPSLVEGLSVDYYGTKTPLIQMASISAPEPRQIVIQPWDRSALGAIESAIRESDLGLSGTNDGIVVRINIPMLTEERRKELVKVLGQKAEEARIAVRGVREDILKDVQALEKSGVISEDDKFKAKDRIQEIVDEYNKKIEELRAKKEQEIMTV